MYRVLAIEVLNTLQRGTRRRQLKLNPTLVFLYLRFRNLKHIAFILCILTVKIDRLRLVSSHIPLQFFVVDDLWRAIGRLTLNFELRFQNVSRLFVMDILNNVFLI